MAKYHFQFIPHTEGNAAKGVKKYPFDDLEVGDYFVVEKTQLWASVRAAASSRKVRDRTIFSCRKTDEGLRVTREA